MAGSFCLKNISQTRGLPSISEFSSWIGRGKEDTPILRRESPESKINTSPHKNALYKAYISVGIMYRVRFLGGTEPHFLVIHLQKACLKAHEGLLGTGDSGPSVLSVCVNTGQHQLPSPPLPAHLGRPFCGEFTTHTGMVFTLQRQRNYPLEVTVGKSYGQLLFQVASPRASLRPWPSRWWALGKQVPGQVHACHSTPGLRQSFKCLHHWIEICLQPLLYFLGDTKGTLPSVHAPGLTKAFIHLLIHSTLSNLPCVRYNQQEVIHSDKCSQHKFVQRATEP